MAIISNAQFKPIIGAEAKVNATPKKQGNLLVATDTGKMFVDVDDTTRHEIGGAGGSVSPFHQHTGADGTGKVSYSDLLNVPTAFVPSAHPHATGDISGLETTISTAVTNGILPVLAAYGVTAGTATALTLAAAGFTLADNKSVRIRLHTGTTGAVTLNVNGTGAKSVATMYNEALSKAIPAGMWLTLVYSLSVDKYILQSAEKADSAVPVQSGGVWLYNCPYSNRVEIKTSQSWICPAGVTVIDVIIIGAGGGGKSGATSYGAGGGGGGRFLWKKRVTVTPGQSYSITIGAGGAQNTSGGSTIAFGFTSAGGYSGGSNNTGTITDTYNRRGGDGGNGGGGGGYQEAGNGGSGGTSGTSGTSSVRDCYSYAGGKALDSLTFDPYTMISYCGGGGGGASGGGGSGGSNISGGGCQSTSPGSGTTTGGAGLANTGGGGGGVNSNGGTGGSGIVIIYY